MTATPFPLPHTRWTAVDTRNLGLIALVWIGVLVLVDPRGQFPMTDDWAYLPSVRELIEHGRLYFSDWGATNLLSHLLWGAVFALPLGTSHFSLRISTLVAALLGAGVLYRLLQLAGADRRLALIGSLTMLLNPLSFGVSFAFMSDVGFTATAYAALLAMAEGINRNSRRLRILAWILGLFALLSRQTGAAIPVAWAAGALFARPRRSIRDYLALLLPILVFVVVQVAYQTAIKALGIAPAAYGRQTSGMVGRVIHHPAETVHLIFQMLPRCFMYFGALGFPVVAAAMPAWLRRQTPVRRRLILTGGSIAGAVVAAVCLHLGLKFPIWPMTLTFFGIGPDVTGVLTPRPIIITVTILAVMGGTFLTIMATGEGISWLRTRPQPTGRFSIGLAAAAMVLTLFAATSLVVYRFDRYLIPMLPAALILVAGATRGGRTSASALGIGGIALAAMTALTIMAEHDVLAVKRVQATVYDSVAARVTTRNVDGGWVLNGPTWYRRYTVTSFTSLDTWLHADYVVEFAAAARPGYRVIQQYPIPLWTPWHRHDKQVLLQQALHRAAPPGPADAAPARSAIVRRDAL